MTAQSKTASLHNSILLASIAGLILSLGAALFSLGFGEGHASFNTASSGVNWGLPVATYVFFVLTSTGLTFVASLAMVFGFTEYYPIAKRCVWLAIATLIAGFASLALELGHPFRMLWAIPLGMQWRSPMNWMGAFYSLYLVLLLLKFHRMNSGDWASGTSHKLGVASFVTVVLAHGTLGSVFGMMAMRPFWYGPLIPVYFLLTAALSGAAFALLITYLAYGNQAAMPERVRKLLRGPMPKVFAAVLGVSIVAMVSRTASGLWSNVDGLEVWRHVAGSPWFWLEVAGLVIAFVLMLSPRTRSEGSMQLSAAIMVAVALFIGRYEYVIAGQLLPMFKGAWNTGLVDYAPSFTEWMVALVAVSLTFAVWAFGEKRLDLAATPAEKAL
jgi:Ni/Fe-hydrogenase subunit HybB-like protein